MADLYPNANRRVSFGCFWQTGCSNSAGCNRHGSCVAVVQKRSIDVTDEYAKAAAAAKRFNPGEQVDIAKLMRAAFKHGYAQALIDSTSKIQAEAETKP